MIDIEQPFVLGLFWAAMGLALLLLALWQVISSRRWRAHYDRIQDAQDLKITESVGEINLLKAQVGFQAEQRQLEQQLFVQRESNVQDRDASSRFRAQGVATVAMGLENWLRVALATLEQHNIPIAPPPPWFGKHRREHDSYPVIEQAREERLQTQINEYKQYLGGQLDWEMPKPPRQEPS